MALIICPICKKEVSDKAERCIRCGYVLKKQTQRMCSECGEKFDANDTYCPNCGCPAHHDNLSKKESRNIQQKIDSKIIRKIISGIIVIVLIVCLYNYWRETNYYENLINATNTMLSDAKDAEECGNQILDVWYDALWHNVNEDTQAYTIENGLFVSDFNDALDNLYEDETFNFKLASINAGQQTTALYMEKLNNPPNEYEMAYSVLCELYDAYIDLTNLILHLDGSYNSTSEDFSKADAEFSKKFDEIELYL